MKGLKMDYDFTDSKILSVIDGLLKKNYSEMSESEIDMLVEYKAEKKAFSAENETFMKNLNELDSLKAEYQEKLKELSASAAQEQYDKMAKKLEEAE